MLGHHPPPPQQKFKKLPGQHSVLGHHPPPPPHDENSKSCPVSIQCWAIIPPPPPPTTKIQKAARSAFSAGPSIPPPPPPTTKIQKAARSAFSAGPSSAPPPPQRKFKKLPGQHSVLGHHPLTSKTPGPLPLNQEYGSGYAIYNHYSKWMLAFNSLLVLQKGELLRNFPLYTGA